MGFNQDFKKLILAKSGLGLGLFSGIDNALGVKMGSIQDFKDLVGFNPDFKKLFGLVMLFGQPWARSWADPYKRE